tara:strand:+ start:2645 stop:3901 length:1257 start_codon:yes stop_codon:yes gene_type:complete
MGIYIFGMIELSNLVLPFLSILFPLLIGIAIICSLILNRTNPLNVRIPLWLGFGIYLFSIANQSIGFSPNLVSIRGFSLDFDLLATILMFLTTFAALTFSLEFYTSSFTMSEESASEKPSRSSSNILSRIPYLSKPPLSDYIYLTKPRLMWLLSLVALSGMAISAGPSLKLNTALLTILGGVLAIGASGTFNQIFEADVDQNMDRTSDRPLATKRIPILNAWIFGISLAVASILVFLQLNLLSSILALSAILFYSVIYTVLLKPNTAQNTVIGGIAGSFPVVIGSAAATSTISPSSILLAALIFFWTPAHFYNLAIVYKKDFQKSGLPMFSVVHGDSETRKNILFYFGATLICALLLFHFANLSFFFLSVNSIFSAIFLWTIIMSHYNPSRSTFMKAFIASNIYLTVLLVSIILELLL